jgi:hypothetical protein
MPDTSVFVKTTPDKTQGKQASGIGHAIAAGAVRQRNFNLPLVRCTPLLLVPFFRMLSFRQDHRWNKKIKTYIKTVLLIARNVQSFRNNRSLRWIE